MRCLLLGSGQPGIRQEAMAEGLMALGYAVVHGRQSLALVADARPFDLVVLWGQKPPIAAAIIADRHADSRPVVIYDLPLLRWCHSDTDTLGLYTRRVGHAWDAPAHHARMVAFGATPKPPRTGRDGVVILGQKPNDASHGLDVVDYCAWLEEAVAHIRQAAPDAPIAFRPHPKDSITPAPMGVEVLPSTEPLVEQVEAFGSALTLCSSAQYEVLAAGLSCLNWSRGDRFGDQVDASARVSAAAWNDWRLEELATAEPWEVCLNGPPAPVPQLVTDAAPAPKVTRTRRKAKAA